MVVPLSISVDDFIVSESVVLFTGKEENPNNGIKNNVVRIIILILKSEIIYKLNYYPLKKYVIPNKILVS